MFGHFASENDVTHILGAILAGGQARRFGSDKAHAQFAGMRLIDHVADALARQTQGLVVCGRAEPRFTTIADRPNGTIGPLGGLNAALQYAGANGFSHVLSAGVDIPNLPDNLLVQLRSERAAIADSQPVVGLWPVELAGQIDDFITSGGRALYRFADAVEARRVTIQPLLLNINRPEDLAQAQS